MNQKTAKMLSKEFIERFPNGQIKKERYKEAKKWWLNLSVGDRAKERRLIMKKYKKGDANGGTMVKGTL